MSENKKDTVKSIFGVIAVFVIAIGGLMIIGSGDELGDWHYFGKKRTAQMEQMFGITVTDDINLKRYSDTEFLTQLSYYLDINNIDDCDKFMQNNVNGKIIKKVEDENANFPVQYLYEWDNYCIIAYFYENNNGSYSATLRLEK